jgi:ribonuclease Z
MRLSFLGTSSGAPTRTRNVSALALASGTGRRWCLVDCGEATQHQLLRARQRPRLSTVQLDAICITHVHGDHCFGLPGLLSNAAVNSRTRPLTLFGPRAIETFVCTALEVSQSHLPYRIDFVAVEPLQPLALDDFLIEPFPLSHRVPSFGYRFTTRERGHRLDVEALRRAGVPRGPAWGALQHGERVRLEDGQDLAPEDFWLPRQQQTVVVAGDNDTPDLLTEACRDAAVLVHEATYTDDLLNERRAQWQHSSALQVARFAEAVKLPNLVLTHFSSRFHREPPPRGGRSIEDVRTEAASAYGGNLFLAADLEDYVLDGDGLLASAS